MQLSAPIKDHHREQRLFVGRVVLAGVIAAIFLSLVITRLVQLQIIDHEHFAERSQGNRFRIEALPPNRGLIYDRKGRILAENLPAYQLELIPEQVPNVDATLLRLAALELIEAEDIARLKELIEHGPRFKPVTLRFRLTEQEISNFAIQRPRFPGVDFQPRLVRHYPHGKFTAHVIGYVGALSADDLARLDATDYAGTSHTGKTGIEVRYEEALHGDPGYRQIITNARGRQIPVDSSEVSQSLMENEAPHPGDNIFLSLDLDLQRVATNALEGKRGSVVAIDPNNGEILALVSTPTFDPNVFALGMTASEFNALQFDPDQPLFNRAVRGNYPPGSTIKPMLALAALETGATNLTRRTFCRGYYTLPGSTRRYRDWLHQGHGEVDLHEAITRSCDVYFYEISREIGIDAMHFYLDQFGLGQASGVDIPGEKAGLVPSREWKRRQFSDRANQVWFPGETVIASIGQGYMLVTPLQLAQATATLAMRGKRFKPHIVAATENPLTGQRELVVPHLLNRVTIDNEFYWDSVLAAMHAVLQSEIGTARAVGLAAPYSMAGKSGTAQVFSVGQDEKYNKDEVTERLRDHALFIAFAPLDEPQIAVAVIVENGSSGSTVAAPIARAVMDEYLGFGDDDAV